MSDRISPQNSVREAKLRFVAAQQGAERARQRRSALLADASRWRQRADLADQHGKSNLAQEARERAQQQEGKAEEEQRVIQSLEATAEELRVEAHIAQTEAVRPTRVLPADLVIGPAEAEAERRTKLLDQLSLDAEIEELRSRKPGGSQPNAATPKGGDPGGAA